MMKIKIKELKALINETEIDDITFMLRLIANNDKSSTENYVLFTYISMGRRKAQEYILYTLRDEIRQFKDLKTGKSCISSISPETLQFQVNLEPFFLNSE